MHSNLSPRRTQSQQRRERDSLGLAGPFEKRVKMHDRNIGAF